MTRRTLIAIASLVAAIAAVGFVATDRILAAEQRVAGMEVISSDATARFVPLVANKAMVIELPTDIKDVLVGSPKIVAAVLPTKRRAYIIALAAGQTDVFFFDAAGRQIGALNVYVTNDEQPAPFVGKSEPQTTVTVFRGYTGFSVALQCTPTNCTSPAQALPDLPQGYQDQVIHNRP